MARPRLAWSERELPRPPGVVTPRWAAIAHGNGVFTVLGDGGHALVSRDGVNWTAAAVPQMTGAAPSITHGNGRFVAVANGTYSATSEDGLAWAAHLVQGPPFSAELVVFGGGLFLSLGVGSTYLTSPDGHTWTARDLPVILIPPPPPGPTPAVWGYTLRRAPIEAAAHGNGRFVAVAQNGLIDVSSDGVEWTPVIPFVPPGGYYLDIGLRRVGPTGSPGYVETPIIALTMDGHTFSHVEGGSVPASQALVSFRSITFGAGVFVAVGSRRTLAGSQPVVATSPDGLTWTERQLELSQEPGNPHLWWSVAHGGGLFVVLESTHCATSQDGVTWTVMPIPSTPGFSGPVQQIAFGGGAFVGVALGQDFALVSDGKSAYLRMNQRNDGLGIERHPRLSGTGTNTPSSAQSTRSTRLSDSNRYE
jgi:hypothetical protein